MPDGRAGHPAPDLAHLDERFVDPRAATEYLERVRWPDGPVCPHCGERERPPYRLHGKSAGRRLWKCRACRRQFTVRIGTMFESSHLPLNKWLLAFHILCSSPERVGPRDLERGLEVSPKTAQSILERVRGAVRDAAAADPAPGALE